MDEELDLARCSLRIKPDRRNGHTGVYLGFERRSRLNSSAQHTTRPSSLRSGDGSRTLEECTAGFGCEAVVVSEGSEVEHPSIKLESVDTAAFLVRDLMQRL
jgi:hypothetical protein